MDKYNNGNNKIDMTFNNNDKIDSMDRRFNRYFSYVFVALVLGCLMSLFLLGGCQGDPGVSSGNVVSFKK